MYISAQSVTVTALERLRCRHDLVGLPSYCKGPGQTRKNQQCVAEAKTHIRCHAAEQLAAHLSARPSASQALPISNYRTRG